MTEALEGGVYKTDGSTISAFAVSECLVRRSVTGVWSVWMLSEIRRHRRGPSERWKLCDWHVQWCQWCPASLPSSAVLGQ